VAIPKSKSKDKRSIILKYLNKKREKFRLMLITNTFNSEFDDW